MPKDTKEGQTKPKIKEWEKEFYELYPQLLDMNKDKSGAPHTTRILKQFISSLLSSPEKRIREEIVKEIKEMKKEPIPELEGSDGEDCRFYNQALQEIIDKLKNKLR